MLMFEFNMLMCYNIYTAYLHKKGLQRAISTEVISKKLYDHVVKFCGLP
jgi:hypothetical protein